MKGVLDYMYDRINYVCLHRVDLILMLLAAWVVGVVCGVLGTLAVGE